MPVGSLYYQSDNTYYRQNANFQLSKQTRPTHSHQSLHEGKHVPLCPKLTFTLSHFQHTNLDTTGLHTTQGLQKRTEIHPFLHLGRFNLPFYAGEICRLRHVLCQASTVTRYKFKFPSLNLD